LSQSLLLPWPEMRNPKRAGHVKKAWRKRKKRLEKKKKTRTEPHHGHTAPLLPSMHRPLQATREMRRTENHYTLTWKRIESPGFFKEFGGFLIVSIPKELFG
jgi:hypothetical protein